MSASLPVEYSSKAIVGRTGWLIAWQSNQLTQRLDQWPRLRVVKGQELICLIDPLDERFWIDSIAERIQLCAIIAPDEQPADQTLEYLLPFQPFQSHQQR